MRIAAATDWKRQRTLHDPQFGRVCHQRGSVAGDQRFFLGSGSVVSPPIGSSRVRSAAVAAGAGAATTTLRSAPVLPSMIVMVTVLGGFAGAGGGSVAVVAGSAASTGAAACGTAITSGAFLAMRRSAGTTATGSPPE